MTYHKLNLANPLYHLIIYYESQKFVELQLSGQNMSTTTFLLIWSSHEHPKSPILVCTKCPQRWFKECWKIMRIFAIKLDDLSPYDVNHYLAHYVHNTLSVHRFVALLLALSTPHTNFNSSIGNCESRRLSFQVSKLVWVEVQKSQEVKRIICWFH